jgi:hypothetical protein
MNETENLRGTDKKPSRTPGGLKGQIIVSDDCFAPMTEEELALWYDGPVFPEIETNTEIPPEGENR